MGTSYKSLHQFRKYLPFFNFRNGKIVKIERKWTKDDKNECH